MAFFPAPERRADFARGIGPRLLCGVLFILALVAGEGVASADEPNEKETTAELRYRLPLDVPITVGGAAFVVVTELDKSGIARSACTLCEIRSDGADTLNGPDAFFRAAFVRNDPSVAATTGDVVGYVVAPVAAVGLLSLAAYRDDQNLHHTPIDLLLTAEATMLAMSMNEATRFFIARERPYFHFASADVRAAGGDADSRLSFFSLHATTTFALAVSAGTIAEMRGYTTAPLIWGTGLMLGVATAYFEMAADKQYFTDVLTGAAVGSLVGFLVPYTLHRPWAANVRLTASPAKGGGTIGATGVF